MISAPLCAVRAADSPSSRPAAQKDGGKKFAQTLQTVGVTGQRASLMQAMKLKENANQVFDAITAQDIRQFPQFRCG